jgi:hypothetical protein
MTPKESYRVSRRSQRYDPIKALNGRFKTIASGIDSAMPLELFEKALYSRPDRQGVETCRSKPMQPGDSFMRGVHYIPPYYPAIAEAAAIKARAAWLEEPVYQRGDRTKVVLPPAPEYAPVTQIRKRVISEKADPYYVPPQLWLPDEVIEAETSSSSSDPLVILLEREGSYQEAYELRQSHRAGTSQTVLKFYMEQRPDRYPQTLPGTVWASQLDDSATEVKPYVRARGTHGKLAKIA